MCGCVYKPAPYWPNVGITSDINQVFLGLFSIEVTYGNTRYWFKPESYSVNAVWMCLWPNVGIPNVLNQESICRQI